MSFDISRKMSAQCLNNVGYKYGVMITIKVETDR